MTTYFKNTLFKPSTQIYKHIQQENQWDSKKNKRDTTTNSSPKPWRNEKKKGSGRNLPLSALLYLLISISQFFYSSFPSSFNSPGFNPSLNFSIFSLLLFALRRCVHVRWEEIR